MITAHTHDQALAREGRMFDVRILHPSTDTLANLGTCDILVVTGSTGLHAQAYAKGVGTMELYGYYGTTVTANGDELTIFNRNPVEAAKRLYTPDVKFYHNPTITADGTEMYTDLIAAGGTQGSSSSGGEQSQDVGFYLAANTTYLLRLKNVSGAAAIAHHRISGHEGW